jgi:flavin-dependent dehydrogenase
VAVDGVVVPVVVGADGAGSLVRSAVAGRHPGRRALALRGYAPTPPERAGTQLIVFGTRRQPSYAWSFDRGDGLANVGYGELVDDTRTVNRSLLLEQLEDLLPGTASTGHAWKGHHQPLSGWRWSHADGRVLLVGDAAGLVNPMSGEGIFYAVATGVAAGRAALGGPPESVGRRYRSAVRSLLARHLRHTAFTSRLTRVPSVVAAGVRAAAGDQRVFDDLVELGLGKGTLSPRLAGALGREVLAARLPFGPGE